MTSQDNWHDDPYLDAEEVSLDGGSTSKGPLWHAVSPRWGHSMHSMCSYQGSFPPRLPHYFIQRFTRPGQVVLDPFCGRGTTVLQARVEGRPAIGSDLNPLAYVLTRSKSAPPTFDRFMGYLGELEELYSQGAGTEDVDPDIRILFHRTTLDQLTFLRNLLLSRPWSRWSRNDFFLAGVVAGILHGAGRHDGSSAYLSISMPNTFSMSPSYVARYIGENNLKPPVQNVFEVIRDKTARLYLDSPVGPKSETLYRDARALLNRGGIQSNSLDLVVTSPPYLKVVNYAQSNWIRLWWLGIEKVARQRGEGRRALDADLDHNHRLDSYRSFMNRILSGIARVLRRTGVGVIVIGDVTEPGKKPIKLADDLWEQIGSESSLKLLEVIEDRLDTESKVSRIWKETRGNATDVDRILVVTRSDGRIGVDNSDVMWHEPYRDAGPDAAHHHLRRRVPNLTA